MSEKMPPTDPRAETGNTSHSMFMRPPEFLKDKAQFRQYKIEVKRWQRVTSVAKKDQGDIIMMSIPQGHKLKQGLELDCGEAVINDEEGVKKILDALELMYGDDQVMDSYLKWKQLEEKTRKISQDVLEYMAE